MKTLTRISLAAILAAGLFTVGANAATLSSKANSLGTSKSVAVSRTNTCSKTMAPVSCEMHCR